MSGAAGREPRRLRVLAFETAYLGLVERCEIGQLWSMSSFPPLLADQLENFLGMTGNIEMGRRVVVQRIVKEEHLYNNSWHLRLGI